MYTKSIIQQTVENLKIKENFKQGIESLMNKYIIEDSVFVIKNNSVYEAVDGYFTVEDEFSTLQEAISKCDINIMGVRVINSERFQIGNLCNTLLECKEAKKVFDLTRLEEIR
jgi:hypothetical protein